MSIARLRSADIYALDLGTAIGSYVDKHPDGDIFGLLQEARG
jgi:hypothetical protein